MCSRRQYVVRLRGRWVKAWQVIDMCFVCRAIARVLIDPQVSSSVPITRAAHRRASFHGRGECASHILTAANQCFRLPAVHLQQWLREYRRTFFFHAFTFFFFRHCMTLFSRLYLHHRVRAKSSRRAYSRALSRICLPWLALIFRPYSAGSDPS